MRIRSVAALAAVPLAVAACSKASSSSTTGGTSTPASASAPAAAANPLASLTADQIAAKAVANLKASSSVHVIGTVVDASSHIGMDLTLAKSECVGTMSEGGQGSFEIIMIGKLVWIKPDNKFWTSAAGASGPVLSLLEGKYLKVTSKTSGIGALSTLCVPSNLAGQMSNATGMSKGKTTTINGQQALELTESGDTAVAYVSDSASPEILRLGQPGQGQLDFTNYNAPVSVTAPPASETLDGSKYGF